MREPITAETGEAVSGAIKVLRGGGDASQGDPSRLALQYFKEAVQNMADEGRAEIDGIFGYRSESGDVIANASLEFSKIVRNWQARVEDEEAPSPLTTGQFRRMLGVLKSFQANVGESKRVIEQPPHQGPVANQVGKVWKYWRAQLVDAADNPDIFITRQPPRWGAADRSPSPSARPPFEGDRAAAELPASSVKEGDAPTESPSGAPPLPKNPPPRTGAVPSRQPPRNLTKNPNLAAERRSQTRQSVLLEQAPDYEPLHEQPGGKIPGAYATVGEMQNVVGEYAEAYGQSPTPQVLPPASQAPPPKPARSKPGQDHIKASDHVSDHVELRQPSGERRRATGMRVLLPSSPAEASLLSKSAGVAFGRRSKKTGDGGEPPKDPEKKPA